MKTAEDVKKIEKVAFILKTIAHPLRICIIDLLDKHEELSVGEICHRLESEQSLTSHHLANMKIKGILGCRREGQKIYYYITLPEVTKVIQCMESCSF
jgi:ArsR family transcriptional regulator